MKEDTDIIHSHFFKCQSDFFEISKSINEMYQNKNLLWFNRFDINVSPVSRNFFEQFPKINQLIDDFECNTYAIFKFDPNTCYGWHVDNAERAYALNMLIEGYGSSYTFVGDKIKDRTNEDFSNVREVPYEANKFVLLDVNSYHTIYNLDKPRYLLTISFPASNLDFNKICEYLIKNNI